MLKTKIYKIETDNVALEETLRQEGACKNQLLVIVNQSDITEENQKTLSQMLNAIKYNLEDSCMIVLSKDQKMSINPFIKKYNIQKVLCFGIGPQAIGLQIVAGAYRLIVMEEINLVFSHSITDLNADKQKKIKLWNTIQGL